MAATLGVHPGTAKHRAGRGQLPSVVYNDIGQRLYAPPGEPTIITWPSRPPVSSASISAGIRRRPSPVPASSATVSVRRAIALPGVKIWLWVMTLIKPDCHPATFRSYYQRLRGRGVTWKVAAGHVAGKLISVLFFCLRNGEPYDPDRHARALGSSDA